MATPLLRGSAHFKYQAVTEFWKIKYILCLANESRPAFYSPVEEINTDSCA
jgi:hypothetical protein